MLTDEEIAKLRALHEAATPAPWWRDGDRVGALVKPQNDYQRQQAIERDGAKGWPVPVIASGDLPADEAIGGADAALVVAARNAVPALLEEVEAGRRGHEGDPPCRWVWNGSAWANACPKCSRGRVVATVAQSHAAPANEAPPAALSAFDSAATHANELERIGKRLAEALDALLVRGFWTAKTDDDCEAKEEAQTVLAKARARGWVK